MTRRVMLGGTLGAGLVATIFNDGASAWAADDEAISPFVHTRARWQAADPRRAAQVLDSPPDRIVVHHTATPNSEDYSVAQAYRLSRDIQRSHMKGRGWDDIGEQLTISRGGHIMEGRNRSLPAILDARHAVGAQVRHHNAHTIGIENEGTYVKARVPQPLWASLVSVCRWLCAVYELDPHEAIVGHRDLGDTSCPGDVLYERLPELRSAVAEGLSEPGAGERSPRREDLGDGKDLASRTEAPAPRHSGEPSTSEAHLDLPDNPPGRPRR